MHKKLNKIKNVFKIICLCFVLFTLTSCSYGTNSALELLHPPKPAGNMYLVSNALEKGVGYNYTLKYPNIGEYKSAFIFCDIEGVGQENYCLALYSLNESTQNIHLGIIKNENKKWTLLSDVSFDAESIEQVTFANLTNDKNLDIVVGYSVYSEVDKKVAVLSLAENKLRLRLEESYNVFTVCNLLNLNQEQLFIANLNASNKAFAHIFSINENGVAEQGSIELDDNITSFLPPKVSFLANDQPAIFLDAQKGQSEISTAVIYFKDNVLFNPYSNILQKQNSDNLTIDRDSTTALTDINGDGRLDIPTIGQFIESNNDSSGIFITEWINYNGSKNVIVQKTYMNKIDGYMLILTDELINNIYISRQTEERRCGVYYKNNDKTIDNLIFEIKVITNAEAADNPNDYKSYFLLSKDDNYSYMANLGVYAKTLNFMENSVQNIFKLINE